MNLFLIYPLNMKILEELKLEEIKEKEAQIKQNEESIQKLKK